MSPCYFCNQLAPAQDAKGRNYTCTDCALKFNHDAVYTSYRDTKIVYGHIYTTINGHQYHIRIEVESNITVISKMTIDNHLEYTISQPILEVDTLSINPSNAKDKLQTYLLLQ